MVEAATHLRRRQASYQLAGEEAAWGCRKSLDFERVVNEYSVVKTRQQLVREGILEQKHHQYYQQQQDSVDGYETPLKQRPTRYNSRFRQSYHRSNTSSITEPATAATSPQSDSSSPRNHHHHHHYSTQNRNQHLPTGTAWARWFLTLMVGLLCGLVAIFLLFSVQTIGSFRRKLLNRHIHCAMGYKITSNNNDDDDDDDDDEFTDFNWMPVKWRLTGVFLEYASINLLLAMTSAVLCLGWAPLAVGSGIPEVKAYLNGVSVPSFADLNVFVVKILATIFAVSSGLIVGPEGPLVHIGAIIGQGITKTARLEKFLQEFQLSHPKESELMGCGRLQHQAEHCNQHHDSDDNDDDDDDSGENAGHGDKHHHHHHHADRDFWRQRGLEVAAGWQSSETAALLNPPSDDPTSQKKKQKRRHRTNRPSGSAIAKTSTTTSSPPRQKPCGGSDGGDYCKHNTILTDFIKQFSKFRNDLERRDLISIGIATGFAAAFGAPVGGLLYSMEEACSHISVPLMWRTLVATALGTLAISIYYGDISRYSVLSLGDGVNVSEEREDEEGDFSTRFVELPHYIFIGAASGCLGAFFNGCYQYANQRRKVFYGSHSLSRAAYTTFKLMEVAFVSILTSIVTYWIPFIVSWGCLENDRGVTGENEERRFNCPQGHWNPVGSILLGSRDDALNDLLTDPTIFGKDTLLVCGVSCLFLMIITFGVAMPTGMFMPTLLVGSSLGAYWGTLIQEYSIPTVEPATFALLGATGMLAGVQRTTVSLVVIMMEATGEIKILIPMIVTVVVARYVGDLFNKGVYHIGLELKEYPFLSRDIMSMFDVPETRLIMRRSVTTLKTVELAGDLARILSRSPDSGFPVVDEDETFVGIIRRDQIIVLLKCGIHMDRSPRNGADDVFHDSLEEEEKEQDQTEKELEQIARVAQHLSDKSGTATWPLYANADLEHDTENEWLKENVKPTCRGSVMLMGTDTTLPIRSTEHHTRTEVTVGETHGLLTVNLSPHEEMCHVDIGAAMNKGAYTIMETAPVSKAYVLFTHMGLRFLTVLGKHGKVVGMITRSTLQSGNLEEKTGMGTHHYQHIIICAQ